MPYFDVAIHGSGLVGQSLALRLARSGFKVALVETSSLSPSKNDVRAFALGHAAKTWLESLGAWSTKQDTTPVAAMHITGDAGGVLNFHTAHPSHTATEQDALNWIVEVPALAARLVQLVASESTLTLLSESSFGTAPQATLHVVCDRRSGFWLKHLQTQTKSQITTIAYGQHAVAARLKSTSPHNQTAKQWFNDAGEVLALLPTGGQGGSTYALVWSLASNRAQDLATIDPDAFLEQLCAAQMGASNALSLTLTSERALWPLNLSQLDVWSGMTPHHWVLAGDAAHTVHPLAGQGLNLGLADAALLAQAVITLRGIRGAALDFQPASTQLQRTLRRYARARKAAASRIASVTDGLHLLYGRQNAVIKRLRNAGLSAVNHLSFAKQWLTYQAQS